MTDADLLAAHLGNTPLAVIEWDQEFRVARWSGQAQAVFGYEAHEVLGKTFRDWAFVHPDDLARVGEASAQLRAAGGTRHVVRNRNLHKSGRVVWCEWHNSTLFDDAGAVRSVLSLVLDVTEARTARADADRGWGRLRDVLDVAGMLGWEVGFDGSAPVYSGDLHAFTGPPDPACPGERIAVVHPDDRAAFGAELSAAARDGRGFRVEYRGFAPAPDGGERHFVARGRAERDADGGRFAGVSADVTAQKRADAERAAMEAALRDARQREAVGLLAAGVAHDFNNILTVILGSAGLAKLEVAPGSVAAARMDAIEGACHRAGELCRQMAAFAGVGRVSARSVDPARVLRDARLADGARPRVRVTVDAEPCPEVRADPELLALLLANLVANAADALPAGGEVRVSARPVADAGPGFEPVVAGTGVVFAVADAGEGMTPAVRARAFEPFFTTRFTGRGLGLSAVQGITRSHHGAVRVTTAPGAGTTVEVFLPARPAAPPAPPPPAATQSSRLALVVDDEPNIRELVTLYLEDAGYTVHGAADGAEGVALLEANPAAYAVVVSDLQMPGAGGEVLAARARALRPGLPVVLMTGYADGATRARAAAVGTAVVEKPFRAAELLAAIRAG